MHFDLSEERQMLADTTRRFIADRYDINVRHAHAKRDEGFDRDTWNELAELGLIGALLPGEVGGFGGTGEDIAVVFESLGRGLVVEPFLATGILGAGPLADAGSAAQKALNWGMLRQAAGEQDRLQVIVTVNRSIERPILI